MDDLKTHTDKNLFIINWQNTPFNWMGAIPIIKEEVISKIFTDYKIFQWRGNIMRYENYYKKQYTER